jgi:hypothetical protein
MSGADCRSVPGDAARCAAPARWWSALGLLLAVATGAVADDSARAQLEQRIALTARLIGDAGTAQRIVASGHARAVSHLDEGKVHQALAEQALAAGDLATARREVDEALRHIGQARRLVPDAPARQAELQQRYGRRLATLERLLEAWQMRDGAQAGELDDRVAAIGLIGQARQRGDERRFDEANQLLTRAESHLLAGMNRLLHQRTIDYSSHASTPAEAFFETLARHEGLIELVPVALAELKPGPDAATLVERYSDTSRTLRQQAVQRQQRGELTEALADLHNAVLYVQRALAAAGVALPAPVE